MARTTLQSPSWRNPGTRAAALLAVLLLCLGLSLRTAPGAAAHDQVVSSSPQSDRQLGTPPAEVKFAFSGPLLNLGHEVVVSDAGGRNWARGSAVVDRASLTQPLSTGMPDGDYRVRWRVVSGDGHPISGSYAFRVGSAAPAASGATPPAAAAPQAAAPQAAADTGTPAASPQRAETQPATGTPTWLAGVLGAAVGLGGYLGYLALRRLRRQPAAEQSVIEPPGAASPGTASSGTDQSAADH